MADDTVSPQARGPRVAPHGPSNAKRGPRSTPHGLSGRVHGSTLKSISVAEAHAENDQDKEMPGTPSPAPRSPSVQGLESFTAELLGRIGEVASKAPGEILSDDQLEELRDIVGRIAEAEFLDLTGIEVLGEAERSHQAAQVASLQSISAALTYQVVKGIIDEVVDAARALLARS